MARKKETTTIPLPDDVGHSFEDEDAILNYRPVIKFVEPEQEPWTPPEEEELPTIDEARAQTKNLINGFDAV
ncbi:MAG: hypothetical protein ACW98Y_20925, partial [Candidatus Thorarchaeota archaeon]